ncbi:NADH-ubiquinone oxidoreductase-F iron-sulfur binding region domain-containing protein [Yinghuangia aomiensis]|uniref:NADH-ubiquinone oxidoreductase-F iron-sulfur binding region domain-containing protein n=1 Tax=Yinghuangia aomiensis TaxID=676205 RepID=A0ABP9I494_9ACTN
MDAVSPVTVPAAPPGAAADQGRVPDAAPHPGTPARLTADPAREPAIALRGSPLIDALDAAALRGRGGAAFPAAVKWRAVRSAPCVVVANGAEGEPASWKDRYLLRARPGLVLDGLLLAAEALGAVRALLYVGRPEDEAAVRTALARHPGAGGVEVVAVADRYVAGEETAVVRAVNDGIAMPTVKPPRPFERGIDGRPTLVQNVETLAHAAWIARHGAEAFRAVGTAGSPGTALVTVDGAVSEVALGTPLSELFAARDQAVPPPAVLAGGYFGGLLAPDRFGLPLDYDAFRAAGSGLGCAAFGVVRDCPVDTAVRVAHYLAAESSRQCGVCLNGTRAMAEALGRVATGHAAPDDPANLARWSETLPGRGACALLDGAALLVRSLLGGFPGAVAAHLDHGCAVCAAERSTS